MKAIMIITLLFGALLLNAELHKLKEVETPKVVVKEQKTTDKLVVVYGTNWCPACKKVKELLTKHKIAFTYKDLESDSKAREALTKFSDLPNTIPKVFVNGKFIGGLKETTKLVESGALK